MMNGLARLRALRRAVAVVISVVAMGVGGDAGRAEAPSPPGGLSGTFERSIEPRADGATGAMTYGIPFMLPAARGDAQPSLSLTYRSGRGTGEAGESWSLGIPSIERAPLSTFPRYVDNGFPADEDRYTYGGQPLTFVCRIGSTGVDGCPPFAPPTLALGAWPTWATGYRYYRLQVEGASAERFFLSPDREHWTVQPRGGITLEFGRARTRSDLGVPAVDRDESTSRVFRWHLVRAYDLHGTRNLTVYSWADLAAPLSVRKYLTDIHYTPPATGWATAPLADFAFHVQLSWETAAYVQFHHTRMDKRRHQLRLRRVGIASKTWGGASAREVLRAYNLRYHADRSVPGTATEAPLWNRSFLRAVEEEGRCMPAVTEFDGRIPEATDCPKLPPMTFDYQPAELVTSGSFVRSNAQGATGVDLNDGFRYAANTALIDIDHNGLPDVVQAWPQNFQGQGHCSAKPSKTCLPSTRLQNCGGDGGACVGAFADMYAECAETPSNGEIQLHHYFVRGGAADGTARLACRHETDDPLSPSELVDIRNARMHTAYLNRGPSGTGSLMLQHNCLDASVLTPFQTLPPLLASHAALFSQWGSESMGPWGDAFLLWSKADGRGFGIVAAATGAQATFCPNAAGGGSNYPALAWVQTTESFWPKQARSRLPTGGDPAVAFVDIDGDGYVDRLGTVPPQDGLWQAAQVHFSRRLSHLETVDGITGPALLPFAGDTSGTGGTYSGAEPSVARARDASLLTAQVVYADVNGDGVVDLIMYDTAFSGTQHAPHVRPGDGRGHFGCENRPDPACGGEPALEGSTTVTGLGKAYRISVPDADKPWPLVAGNIYTFQSFFHDVTGDGLADIVQLDSILGGLLYQLKLWVNVDGHTFRCADNANACVVATLADPDKPALNALTHRVMFADIDGNGSEDFVLLGQKGIWHFSFVASPPLDPGPRASRSGLLTRIRSGIGADTEISYRTIQELDLAAQAPNDQSFTAHWRSHSAQVVPIVTKIVTRDTAQVTGTGLVAPYGFTRTTRYSYRNPAYDPWERSFKGFGRVRASQDGGHVVETRYWFSDCEGWNIGLCSQGSDGGLNSDGASSTTSHFKAYAGLPVRIDRFLESGDEPINWLSTTTLVYGGDGWIRGQGNAVQRRDRDVQSPSVTRVDEYLYDTAAPVVLPPADEIQPPTAQQDAPLQESKRVHIVKLLGYDAEGNLTQIEHKGRVLDSGAYVDATITQFFGENRCSSPYAPVNGEWACLLAEQMVTEQGPNETLPTLLRHVKFIRDDPAAGDFEGGDIRKIGVKHDYPRLLFATQDPLPLERNLALGTGEPPDAIRTRNEWRTMVTFERDAFGNAVRTYGSFSSSSQPCTDVVFDPVYRQFPARTTSYAQTSCSGGALSTDLVFDRGLGTLVSRLEPTGALTTVGHDAFGRLMRLDAPAPDVGPQMTQLALEVTHVTAAPLPHVKVARRVGVNDTINSVDVFNALGEHVISFDQADVNADGAPWIARDWTARDLAGRVSTQYRPFFFSGDPDLVATTAAAVPPQGNQLATEYDGFHRVTHRLEQLGGAGQPFLTLAEYRYRPLEMEIRDAEQAKVSGTYAGLFTTVALDSHGRVEKTIARNLFGPTTTRAKYLGTGEPIEICRSDWFDADCTDPTVKYLRTMKWDTLGRLRENMEPNTSRVDAQGQRHGWRYVYDDVGRLVGTSDARGCGKNIYYDSLSRVIAEDFSPCEASQPAYSPPDLASGDGTEAFFQYDAYLPGQVVPEVPAFQDHGEYAIGRLVAIAHRGSHTRFNYDVRGRVRRETRQIAKPGAPSSALAERYASNTFTQRTDFDLGDRVTVRSTGLVDNALLVNGKSEETYAYSARGALRAIGGSYGALVSSLQLDANGNLLTAKYADAATTRVDRYYDSRKRLRRAHVHRFNPPAIWSNPPAGYSPPPAETMQLDIADHFLILDDVSNPTSIVDASGATWPVGAKPVARTMQYDGFYRLTQIQYAHGGDEHVVPFEPEAAVGDRHPVAEVHGASRVQQQNITYDALGNTTSTADNEGMRYDRSLGSIVNGSSSSGPNQLREADGIRAAYDEAGNLRELTVARDSCWGAMPNCSHRFKYDWDEVGQLLRARRWDYPAGNVPSLDPADTPEWELSYAYSGGARTRTAVKEGAGADAHTLDVFATLKIKDVPYLTAPDEYRVQVENEVGFVGGVGRVFVDVMGGLPRATGSPRHVLLHIGDHLGSTSMVIDKDSGELVERASYQAFGALDADFRPTRWNHFRAEHKFTGKEEDIEVGLTYFGARYYHARLGRWASADPLTIHGLGSDLNPYAYVSGQVMSHIDPFGLDDCSTVFVDSQSTTTKTGPCPKESRNDFDRATGTNPILNRLFGSPLQQVVNQTFLAAGEQGLQAPPPPKGPPLHGDQPWRWHTFWPGLRNSVLQHWFGAVTAMLLQGLQEPAIDNPAYDFGYALPVVLSMVGPAIVGRLAGAAEGVFGGGPSRWPFWSYGNTGGALGATDKFGNITIRPGLTGRTFWETLAHEAFHSVFSPRAGGPFQTLRADLKMWGYRNSNLLRFTEEAGAELYATNSLSRAVSLALRPEYRISLFGLGIEATLFGGIMSSAFWGPSAAALAAE